MNQPPGRPSPRNSVRLGLLLGFGAYACWGLLSPVGKHLLDDLDPLWLNAVRFALATAVLLPLLGWTATRDGFRLLGRKDVLWFNLLANTSLTAFLYSLVRLEATQATLLFYSAPLWTAALAHFTLRERVGGWFAPAIAGLLGGGYVALFGLAGPGRIDTFGLLLATLSAVLWAFYTVALRKAAPGLPLRPLMGSSFLAGTLYFAPLALVFEGMPVLGSMGQPEWAWMAVYVAVPSLGSFLLFNAALKYAPAGQVNILVAAELAFTALFAWLLFGDKFSTVQVAGLVLALASVTIYLWMRERTPVGPQSAG